MEIRGSHHAEWIEIWIGAERHWEIEKRGKKKTGVCYVSRDFRYERLIVRYDACARGKERSVFRSQLEAARKFTPVFLNTKTERWQHGQDCTYEGTFTVVRRDPRTQSDVSETRCRAGWLPPTLRVLLHFRTRLTARWTLHRFAFARV